MSDSYYDRDVVRHIDGTPIFQTAGDEHAQAQVAEQLAAAWGCEIHSFGRLSPVDWYATRDGRVIGVLELKARTHPAAKYPTVFLNVRKWLALQLAGAGMGVPPIFVVKFTDQLRWVRVDGVRASVTIGGCTRIVKSRNDIEPVFEIPVNDMHTIDQEAIAA